MTNNDDARSQRPSPQDRDKTPSSRDDGTPRLSGRPPNPLGSASFLSRLVFSWAYPLMRLGMTRTIVEADLPDVQVAESSATNLSLMDLIWNREVERARKASAAGPTHNGRRAHRPNLRRALLFHYFRTTWFAQVNLVAAMGAKLAQAIALGSLIETFGDGGGQGGYMWAGILILCAAIVMCTTHLQFFDTWRMG